MQEADLHDGDEGNHYRLFDLLDFSGENKSVMITRQLARAALAASDRDVLAGERDALNDRIKQLRAERKRYFDVEGDGVDVLLIDIQDHFDRAALVSLGGEG